MTSPWTHSSNAHLADPDNTFDLPFVNNDSFGSTYQLLGSSQSHVLSIKHLKEALKPGVTQLYRHSVQYDNVVYGSGGSPDLHYSAVGFFRMPYNADLTAAVKVLSRLTGFFTDADVKADLVNWRL